MNTIQYSLAKTGKQTCTVNGIRLHSAYDPVKEAQRFVSGIDFGFIPKLIVVTEPALSYCVDFLRQTYPDAILVAIRFTHDFDEYNYLWDKVFDYDNVIQILNIYGEDVVLAAGFLSWQPSQQVYSEEYNYCWQQIKNLVQTSRDILGTRAYFGKRWLKNTISFCSRVKNTSTIEPGTAPILLVASGPSLKSSLDYIIKYRDSFFLIALSSALSPLLAAGIQPDICISTDGGYWAKRHIDFCSIPLALPAEAAIAAQLFEKNIIPLKYGDAPESELLDICKIPSLQALRNGTVSGTALELALTLTTGPVFACGLDLATAVGFQHCQPNRLEMAAEAKDQRLTPKETRLFPQQLPSQSLEIYAQWFVSQSTRFKDRFYRLAHSSYQFSNRLGVIQDIDWKKFVAILAQYKKNKATVRFPVIRSVIIPDERQRYNLLLEALENYKQQKLPHHWLSTLLPAEQALLGRTLDKSELEAEIKDKSSKCINEIIDYLKSIGEKKDHVI
ncbi:MAG: DUF115 domain-containing protein [Spirochaetaceae bacterium]|nr:DUF115 domain-containing protein [Spirochaetaceae bacterium]